MEYIIINNFNGNINIVYKEDGSDEPWIFDTIIEAEYELKNYQNGQIIPLGVNLIAIMKEQNNTLQNGN